MQTPAPPSLAPLNAQGQMSARVVHAIHAAILRGRSFRTAAMSQHVSHDLNEWRRRAALGDDPFWPWAVEMVESAQAEALGQVEEAHRTVALTGTLAPDVPASPSAVRAQENALKSAAGSDLYTDPDKAQGTHGAAGGGAGVTINTILMYLGGGAAEGPGGPAAASGSAPRGLGALVDGAWGGGGGRAAHPYDLDGVSDGDVVEAPKRTAGRVSFKAPGAGT